MTATIHYVDGKTPLGQQQDTLNFMEQFTASQVITYGKATAPPPASAPANQAVFMPVPFGQQPPPLELSAVDNSTEAAHIIGKSLSGGKRVIFQESAWVEGRDCIVLGFRQTSQL